MIICMGLTLLWRRQVEKLADESINYVRRGGTLMIYGVYENKALFHWPPSKVHFDCFVFAF